MPMPVLQELAAPGLCRRRAHQGMPKARFPSLLFQPIRNVCLQYCLLGNMSAVSVAVSLSLCVQTDRVRQGVCVERVPVGCVCVCVC